MAGCAPARHRAQQHLSRSAAACAGAHAGSRGPLAARALPGAAGAHDAAPALELPLSLSPSRLSSSAPWVHPCLCRIHPSPGAGRSLPHRVCAQPCMQGRNLPRSRGPSPPWSPKRGVEPWLCLACLAMQGNSQFPRELLSPGQPCSPNIYISHYCLHMSLFSGGVSSFPLLPQCSPCSISSGAAIPNAVLCSHYCLINLQGKAKLS